MEARTKGKNCGTNSHHMRKLQLTAQGTSKSGWQDTQLPKVLDSSDDPCGI